MVRLQRKSCRSWSRREFPSRDRGRTGRCRRAAGLHSTDKWGSTSPTIKPAAGLSRSIILTIKMHFMLLFEEQESTRISDFPESKWFLSDAAVAEMELASGPIWLVCTVTV